MLRHSSTPVKRTTILNVGQCSFGILLIVGGIDGQGVLQVVGQPDVIDDANFDEQTTWALKPLGRILAM